MSQEILWISHPSKASLEQLKKGPLLLRGFLGEFNATQLCGEYFEKKHSKDPKKISTRILWDVSGGVFSWLTRVLSKDLVHSHVSNNADDGLNGMDFGQAECDSYFMTGAVVGVGFGGVRSLKGAQVEFSLDPRFFSWRNIYV